MGKEHLDAALWIKERSQKVENIRFAILRMYKPRTYITQRFLAYVFSQSASIHSSNASKRETLKQSKKIRFAQEE